jgi:hypothetical protein
MHAFPYVIMRATTRRFWIGAWDGLLATLVMSVGMTIVWMLNASSMRPPIPLALAAIVVARAANMDHVTTGDVIVAVPIHFAYGALWGGLLAESTHRVTWWMGGAVGLGLWAIMMVFMLPLGGADAFSVVSSPWMWVVTLALHLVYGFSLGLLMDRQRLAVPEP